MLNSGSWVYEGDGRGLLGLQLGAKQWWLLLLEAVP